MNIRAALRAIGDRPFLVAADGSTQSGLDVLDRVDVHAAWLTTFDAVPGDVIALRALPPASLLRMSLAALAEGLVAWPQSYRDPPEVITRRLRESRARFVVSGTTDCMASRDLSEGRWRLGEAGTLLGTSGTSGATKFAFHTLDAHVQSAASAVEALDFGSEGRWLLSLPLYHIGGVAIVMRALTAGASVVIPKDGAQLTEALRDHAPTHVSLVATQLFRLLAQPEGVALLQACRCVLIGGGPLPAALRAEALEKGIPLAVCYGSTETAAFVAATQDPAHVARPACAGPVVPGRRVEIADDGEIHVAGPTLLRGYLGPDGVDPTPVRSGTFATGDVGRLDADGLLYVLGRRDRMFVSGGENIQPEEIEAALEAQSGIERAVVVDVFDDEFGRRPVAFLQTMPGLRLARRRIEDDLREAVAGFKVPDAFWRLPLEHTRREKPDLPALVAMAAEPDRYRLEPL